MIFILRPPIAPQHDFQRYCHCWDKMGRAWGEPVSVVDDTESAESQLVAKINQIPGRWVVLVRPQFIPSLTFRQELDLYRDEKQLVICLQDYEGVWQLKHEHPCQWEPKGVSRTLAVFQLTGQHKWKVPTRAVPDIWKWLGSTPRGNVYRVPQQFAGMEGCAFTVSKLGTVVLGLWGGTGSGRLITGDRRFLDPQHQLAAWRAHVEAWEQYLERWPQQTWS